MAFWIKNPTASSIWINDLGVGVEASHDRDLSLVSGYPEIESSADLQAAFDGGTLQRLDGPGGAVIAGTTDNVTGVSSGDVDNDAAIWNADRLQGLTIDNAPPSVGDALVWDGLVMAPGKQNIRHHELLDPDASDDHTQYHNDGRALTWLGQRSTDDLPEGTNLYYTDSRVAAHADVLANTQQRHERNKDTVLDEGGPNETTAEHVHQNMQIMHQFMGSGIFTGGNITKTTGVGFHVSAGTGIVNTGTDIVTVSWPDTGLSASYTGVNYVYVDGSGSLQIGPSPCPSNCAHIGIVTTDNDFTDVIGIVNNPRTLAMFTDLMHDLVHHAIGVLIDSGLSVSEDTTPLHLYSAPGTMYMDAVERSLPSATSFTLVYKTPTGWDNDGVDVIDPDKWNDTSQEALQTMPAGKWKKDLVMRDYNGNMYVAYAQQYHDTHDDAKAGPLPEMDELYRETNAFIAAVITQQGATAIDTILDIRPLLSRVFGYGTEGAAGTVISHSSLTNLGADDHPQYHNDARALTWLGTRSTDDLPEGANEYFTDGRVSANSDVAANSQHRQATTGNPHQITASDVGNDTAQWNASKLQGRDVGTQAPADGEVVTWNAAANEYQPANLGTVQGGALFEAFDGAGGTTVGNSWTNVPLGDVRQQTPQFTALTDGVQIDEDGLYLIMGRVTTNITSGTSRTDSRGRLTLNGSEVGGTQVALYNRTANYGENTGSFMAALNLVAGDVLRIQALRDDGSSTLKLLGDGSGIMIFQNKGPKGDQGVPGSGSTIAIRDGGVDVTNTPHSAINVGEGLSVEDAGGGQADIAAIFGSDFAYAEDAGEATTTSTNWQTRLTLTKVVAGGTYHLEWYGEWNFNSISQDFRSRVLADGQPVAEMREEPQDSGSEQYSHFDGHAIVTLAAGSRDMVLQFASSSSSRTAKFRNVRLTLWRVS